jgi:hypothetical protein
LKDLLGTNTLAYFADELVTKKKSFFFFKNLKKRKLDEIVADDRFEAEEDVAAANARRVLDARQLRVFVDDVALERVGAVEHLQTAEQVAVS